MNVRHLMGVLHSFFIKNIFYDKMDLRLFYFHVTIFRHLSHSHTVQNQAIFSWLTKKMANQEANTWLNVTQTRKRVRCNIMNSFKVN